MKERDLRLDGLKFFLIFLVVLGHLQFYDYGIWIGYYIYSFHMPVFVFLSGFFSSANTKKEKRNAWVKQTLIIFVCAQIAHIILSFILNKPITWKVLITPCYTLWYLVCLIYWRLFLWAVNNKCKDSILLLASFILLILCGFVPINQEFSFQRTFSFFPYFILGFLLKKNGMMNRIEAIPIQVAILFLIMELIVARFLPLYMPRTYFHSLNDALIRVSQTILGVALCLSIIRLSRIRYWEYVAKYGKYTLWIYIGHSYLILIIRKLFPYYGITLNVFEAFLIALFICIFFILLAKNFKRIKERRFSFSSF